MRIKLQVDNLRDGQLDKIKQLILSYRGSVEAQIIFEDQEARGRMHLGKDYLINPTPQFAAKINELVGQNSVQLLIDGQIQNAL